jgi:drug/metabolite transporter (DMT)-like permease
MTTSKSSHEELRKKTLIAIALTCVAYGYFNIGDAALKMLGGRFDFPQIIITNCTIIIICMTVSGWLKSGKKAFAMRQPKWIAIRAVCSCITTIMNTVALPHLKLTTFYTLVFTSPFLVAVLAAVILKEKLERHRAAVILAGFAVIVYVFRPGGGLFDYWALLILIGAFFYSCGLTIMRKLGPHESRTMIIIMGSAVSILMVIPLAYIRGNWHAPGLYDWGLFLLMGSLGAVSVTCIAYAFQTAPSAAVVAPYHYTQIVWGALLGYYLFNEIPDDRTILGAALIIACGLYLLLSETRRKQKPDPLPDTGVVS